MFNRSFRDFHCLTDKLYYEYAFKPTLAMRKQTKKGEKHEGNRDKYEEE